LACAGIGNALPERTPSRVETRPLSGAADSRRAEDRHSEGVGAFWRTQQAGGVHAEAPKPARPCPRLSLQLSRRRRFRARSSQPAADAGSRRASQAGDVPEAVPNRRYRQSLNPIFNIVSGVSSKAGLELRESRIESRLAHLVVATAVAAGLSDCPRMQESPPPPRWPRGRPTGRGCGVGGADPQRGDPVRGHHVGPEPGPARIGPSEVSPASVLSRRRSASSTGRTGAAARVTGVRAGGAAALWSTRSAWATRCTAKRRTERPERQRPFG
jgi:hypothetical protein